MDIRFDNKVIVVTGASSGIGKATAIEFAKSGARVVVHYNSNKQGADDVVDQIDKLGVEVISVSGDLSKSQHVDRLIHETMDRFGTIDILINNAGTLVERRTIETMDENLWTTVMDVNLTSVYLCCKAVIPIMKEKGFGRIVNLTSVAARNGGGPGAGHYSTAKAGVLTFTKSLAKELAGTGILVNAVSPGVITTPFHDKYSTHEARKMYANNTPLKREGTPEEVAYGILFLASEYASFIVGETMEINGGLLMD
ncbi:MAG: SDR family oxidoreductase [Cyclobacteriaceae bacterium]|nr:SDR family oxidoreductase [Cyclobacteriaceae bacterium]MCK5280426.1 SDR family oxidoreductase [Cyclobacteriaceae bacterium]